MAELHEVLAVDQDVQNKANKIVKETIKTFKEKSKHFEGFEKSLKMFDDKRSQEEADGYDFRLLVTTVNEKLHYTWQEALSNCLDTIAQKEVTNQTARADVVIDGEKILADMPATLLLTLENKLKNWRSLYDAIPTYNVSEDWVPDDSYHPGSFRTKKPNIKNKTEKTIKSKVLYGHTDKHPAQIEKWTEDVPIGIYTTTTWTGAMSPADKSRLLGRIDKLIHAIKKARMRANKQEVFTMEISKKIYEFIHRENL